MSSMLIVGGMEKLERQMTRTALRKHCRYCASSRRGFGTDIRGVLIFSGVAWTTDRQVDTQKEDDIHIEKVFESQVRFVVCQMRMQTSEKAIHPSLLDRLITPHHPSHNLVISASLPATSKPHPSQILHQASSDPRIWITPLVPINTIEY